MDLFLTNAKILGAALLVFLSFGLVGARFAKAIGAEQSDSALNPFYGWAITILLMLGLAPWLAGGGIIAFLLVLCVAGFFMLSSHSTVMKTLPMTFFIGVLLLLPLLYGLCMYPLREWDDMSHWLPNAHFLFQYGRFPATDGPVAYSAWPAYPYGFMLLISAMSWIVGTFVEPAGPILNFILLILLAAFVGNKLDPEASSPWQKARIFAVTFLAFTLFNPSLDLILLLSAYGEYATAVMLAFLLYIGWQLTQNPQRSLAISLALLAIIFVQIKQSNIFLLALLGGSLWITSQNKKQTFITLLLSLLPAILVHGFWEFYKAQHLPGLAFTFKPFADWQWFFLPDLFNAMGIVTLEKIGFSILLFGLIGWGISCCFKKDDRLRTLVISFALVAVGHFAFLTLAYIGSRFSEWEVRTAASFFRYMSQLQMAAMMIVLLKLTDIICIHFRHTYPALRIGGTLLVIAIPVAGLVITGFDLFEKPNPSIQHTRDYAKAIFPHMPAHGKVGMIGTTTNGLENTMIRFQWCLMASMKHEPELTGYATQYTGEKTVDDIKRFAERYDAVMVAPHDDLAMKALGEPLNENWVSFIKNGNRWTKIQEKDK